MYCLDLIVRIRTSYMHACTHTYIINVKNYIPESRGSRAFQCFMSVGFAGLEKPFCFWLENALSRTTSFCLKVPVYRSKEAQPYPTMSDVRLVLQVHFRSFPDVAVTPLPLNRGGLLVVKKRPKARLQIETLHLQFVLTHRGVFMFGCGVDANWERISKSMFAGTAKDPLHIFVFLMIPSSTSIFVHLSKCCNQPAACLWTRSRSFLPPIAALSCPIIFDLSSSPAIL